jgi:tRNA(fMet)-specific endonuclease VapC
LLSGFKGGSREKENIKELEEFLDAPRVQIYGIDEDTALIS